MARSTLVRTFVLGVALALTITPGCAKQGEGERCEPNSANDSDCDDGLECVLNDQLLDPVDGANDFGRCCPPMGESISDERCARVGTQNTGGTGGTGGMTTDGGAAGMAGADAMGGAPAVAGAGGDAPTSGAGGDLATAGASGSGTGAAGSPGAGGQSGAPSTAGAGGI